MYGYNKDIFVEQLIKIEQNSKTKSTKISIWVLAILLTIGLTFLSILHSKLIFIFVIFSALTLYGAYYLCTQLNVEYEYIITNGQIDIDCIVNQQKRHRMASFKCTDITIYENFNPIKHKADKTKRIYYGCTPDNNCIAITVKHPKGGVYTVVLNLNEEFKAAIKKFADYEIKKCI